jgi:hypothetical protein
MNRIQTLAIALLGVWIGWTLFMWYMAGRSFTTVDRVLRKPSPQFSEATQPSSPEQSRELLRYTASEINRTMFRAYGAGQMVLGAILFLVLYWQAPRDTFSLVVVGCMLAIVLILAVIVTPQVISLGRNIDFLPRNPPPPGMQRFWKLHGAFTGLDSIKLLAGLVVLGRWIFKG